MYPTHPVLDAVVDIHDELCRLEAESCELRRLAPGIVKRFRDIGVMRLLQPSRYGGYEAEPRVFNEAMYAISRASSCAGWVTGVVGVHSWHIGLFEDRTQAEVLGDNPDTWISSSYGPAGQAMRVPGGHVLSGRWSFSSGCDYCDWVFVGGLVADEDGGPPEYRHFLLPRADYTIVDVWHASGLIGTGSNDIVVSEQFVPEHRSLNVADTLERRVPGKEVNTGPSVAPAGCSSCGGTSTPASTMPRTSRTGRCLSTAAISWRARPRWPRLPPCTESPAPRNPAIPRSASRNPCPPRRTTSGTAVDRGRYDRAHPLSRLSPDRRHRRRPVAHVRPRLPRLAGGGRSGRIR
jgi:hypothetical protein